MIALQVLRTSFRFHLRECMGSCLTPPPPPTPPYHHQTLMMSPCHEHPHTRMSVLDSPLRLLGSNRLLCLLFPFAGSCKNVYHCPYHAWSAWSGSIAQGSCGKQSRYRDFNEQVRYDVKEYPCNGIQSCGSREYNYRTFCELSGQYTLH